jgi:hypothetical protein
VQDYWQAHMDPVAEIDADIQNIRAAWAWQAKGDPGTCHAAGGQVEARRWLAETLDVLSELPA